MSVRSMATEGKESLEFLDTLYDLANTEQESQPDSSRRPYCQRCRRPITVCWCPFLPKEPVDVMTVVYILQHPFEESRSLRTAPILYESLSPGKCRIIKGKKFLPQRYPEVNNLLQDPNTILLYPQADAIDIKELPPCGENQKYNLVLLDGTWAQAKTMYLSNPTFTWPRKVKINHSSKSKYVIRTQPNDSSLSTLECAAVALSILEQRTEIVDILTRPLEALCEFQLKHGACKHDSKEFRIENGLWHKTLSQKLIKRREKQKQEEENALSATVDS